MTRVLLHTAIFLVLVDGLAFATPGGRVAPAPVSFAEQRALDPHPVPEGGGGLYHRVVERIKTTLQGRLTMLVVGTSLVFAFLVGALCALQPGHGKTLVAAYLVGSRGTVRHAIALGIIVTFTHTFSILLLGAVVLFLSNYLLAETMSRWLEWFTGALVFGLGLWMFARILAGKGMGANPLGPGHSHPPPAGSHPHGHGEAPPGEKRATPGISAWGLLGLGIAGGIVPCPDALVLLLIAVAFNRILFGLAIILAFSAGIASVLIAVGIMMVSGKDLIGRFKGGEALLGKMPAVSATFITMIGAGMLYRSLAG